MGGVVGYGMSGLEGGGELHHYMIFVTLKKNSSSVQETIVSINLIKLTKKKYKYCTKVFTTKKEGFIYNRYFLQLFLTDGWFIKSARRSLIILS